jgi:hypothetical protein
MRQMGILKIKHNTGGYLPILTSYFVRLLYPLKWSAPHLLVESMTTKKTLLEFIYSDSSEFACENINKSYRIEVQLTVVNVVYIPKQNTTLLKRNVEKTKGICQLTFAKSELKMDLDLDGWSNLLDVFTKKRKKGSTDFIKFYLSKKTFGKDNITRTKLTTLDIIHEDSRRN